MSKGAPATEFEKDVFIDIMTKYTPFEINKMIRERGNDIKPITCVSFNLSGMSEKEIEEFFKSNNITPL